MARLEWDPENVPSLKLGLHSVQMVISFTIWCLEIAVFVGKDAKVVGNNAWTFSVCFLSIPAWLYLILTPRSSRARRFADPHAMLLVDVLFAILWLSAFATQAAFNTANLCGQACNQSKAIVGLGVLNALFFAASSGVSAYTLQYYQLNGTLPGYDSRRLRAASVSNNIDPDKAAFSMAPHDEEAYERVDMDDHEAAAPAAPAAPAASYSSGAGYGHANPYGASGDDSGRYGSLPPRSHDLFNSDTEYISGGAGVPPSAVPFNGVSHNPYTDAPAHFPPGDYARIQS